MKFFNGKKVVGLYHRGHKVLYQYHRGRLVYFDHSEPINVVLLNGGEPIQLFGGEFVELNKN